ncbi:transmembrane protein adipocyte-associated 1 homolog isoform X2 [Pomacea canaliculata]|uniref:transmembrane protein adipocyte-associated 1 homolog isoform X2 n=1 Tax=Pomacea canaliculata TaxID=400727 RepID=UPI000D732618|nr:transmembrane protein adipocyte-associated 1 homolog isoform X2 [Pomacea canaliculata]
MADSVIRYAEDPRGMEDTNVSTLPTSAQNILPQSITTGMILPFVPITEPPCQWILYSDIGNSRVQIWDVMILVPNALFLVFLLWRLGSNIDKLRASSSPIFTAFIGLVLIVSVIGVLRCIVSMTVDASEVAGEMADKMLWLILRFFLLGTEASVVIFGVYFGHLDSRTSIRRVLICTSLFALAYSFIQGTLELKNPHLIVSVRHTDNTTENYDIFAHGGMIFLCSSSALFFVVYMIILVLPLTSLRHRFTLPTKRTFYYYVGFLATLNLTQAVGSLLLYYGVNNSLCVIDVTTYLYFTIFAPMVYGTFLWKFLKANQAGIFFSYKHQVDEVLDDDQLSLPYQTPFAKTEADAMVVDNFVHSTQFDHQANHSSAVLPHHSHTTNSPQPSINSDYYHIST